VFRFAVDFRAMGRHPKSQGFRQPRLV